MQLGLQESCQEALQPCLWVFMMQGALQLDAGSSTGWGWRQHLREASPNGRDDDNDHGETRQDGVGHESDDFMVLCDCFSSPRILRIVVPNPSLDLQA